MTDRELTEREKIERAKMAQRLKGRKPPTREEWEDVGIPHFQEPARDD